MFFNKLFERLVNVNTAVIFMITALVIGGSSFAIYYIEPEEFGSPFNGFWWVMTSVTTVGFGDYVPDTVPGKLYGIFLYLVGIGLISIVISKIIDFIYVYNRRKERGKLEYNGKDHIVIADWSKHAKIAIQEILNTEKNIEIVLIDQYEETPYHHDRLFYVRGNPVDKEVLEQANISEARAVFVFPNEITINGEYIHDPSYIDGKSLLIATSIQRHFKDIYTIVEIKERNNIHNFTHVDVDEFIVSSEMISQLAVRSAFSRGTSRIVSQLLSKRHGEDLYEIPKRPSWKTYREAYMALLEEGATLVSDHDDLNINHKLDERIPEDAKLFVICQEDTYHKISGKEAN
ncbi:potassium channel family protein [Marinococcus halotolerans]|uniref:potassium channel family protein n=1 Tax=Marinococcus halotolerans TaxID=301092 RepID=UPI0003B57315|nr:potassium channel family protein [Marinococcus halotolerans]